MSVSDSRSVVDGVHVQWGMGENGRLGHGDNTTLYEPKPIDSMVKTKYLACGDHFCASIDTEGTLYTWGHNKVTLLGLFLFTVLSLW